MSFNKSKKDDDIFYSLEDEFAPYSDYDIFEEYIEDNFCISPDWKEVTQEDIKKYEESKFDIIQSEKSSSASTKKPQTKYIHQNHRTRVRDKFFKFGLECFSEYEVLEFLLFYAIPRKDTNVIAHKLIDRFGSLNAVLNAEYYDLMEVDGISEVSASLITLQREISKYLKTSNKLGITLSTAKKAGEFCCDYFERHVEESAILIILDGNKTILAIDVISRGSETETALYSRKIIKSAIRHRCSMVMLAHNHPSADSTPSSNDIVSTNRMIPALEEFGIEFVDHIICGQDGYTSMSDKNMIHID